MDMTLLSLAFPNLGGAEHSGISAGDSIQGLTHARPSLDSHSLCPLLPLLPCAMTPYPGNHLYFKRPNCARG